MKKTRQSTARWLASAVLALAVAGATPVLAQTDRSSDLRYPDVIDVKIRPRGADRFDFDVTISSPYDSPQRYADAFRIMSADGKVHGERTLLHDHANEQPFTRDLYGVVIPPKVRSVVVQARDRKYGYGGRTAQIALPGR
jgi:hypothetical protein